ncbi:MAG: asparagine synthase (glutamine-hydrolyzing) [Anaerolineales bacterium]|nr:asparagine synthase (glutamine-hydrolyzing) [Anaerolineales bacterium]
MCGICGIFNLSDNRPVEKEILLNLNATLKHRGPDDAGYYIDDRANVGLAMRRLSIIDLSTGSQPIANEDKTVWIVFNGEIYNYLDLRSQLLTLGHRFSTKSDTETIIHAYEQYGDDCVHYLNGMFSFAIWDSRKNRLLLVRDRLGIKPLYYYLGPDLLVFSSELKALLAHPQTPRDIDLNAVDHFLTLEYIPAPYTILKGICKLPAGYRLIVENGRVKTEQYWDLEFQPVDLDEEKILETLDDLLRDAVKSRLMADVPLGVFLSGGIDSAAVVSYMSEVSDLPVKTFSIGFGDPTYNELPYARLVSNQFGTQHHEQYLEPNIPQLVENIGTILDEPLADFSVFSTYLVSTVASQFVKVCLTGDGGDEVFGGYETYVAQSFDQRYYHHLPNWIRSKLLPGLANLVPPTPAKKGLINKSKRYVEGGVFPAYLQHTRWMMFLSDNQKALLYQPEMHSALGGESPYTTLQRFFSKAASSDALTQQQYVDIKTYLAENILTKVDRMSMAASLEARVPLLDYRIVEFVLNLPSHMLLDKRGNKKILRRIMGNRLPQKIINKKKEGFSVPVKHWLSNELQPLMADLLSDNVLRSRGYFNPDCVSTWISEHTHNRANHSHRLWALMVLELWHQQILDQRPAHSRLPDTPVFLSSI